MPVIRAIDKLEDILASSENFLQRMHELGQDPHRNKRLKRLFSPSEAAEMVGRDRTTLGRAEADLGFQDMARNPTNNRRVGYTLDQIQAFRAHFGTLPWRDPETDAPIVVAIQNFKGGVGKSTTCVNFAHYLALKGYRVLVVDADSQATTTSMFGYVPDADIDAEQTVLPYLIGEQSNLAYAVRPTYFPNIYLIPSCLALYEAEMQIVVQLATQPDPARAGGVLLRTAPRHRDGDGRLRHCADRQPAGARHDLDQRAAGGRRAAGARAPPRCSISRARCSSSG